MDVAKRQEIERKVVRHAIRSLRAAGWQLHSVYDGGDEVKVSTEEEAMDAVFAVDDSTVRFTKEGVKGLRGFYVVLGNDGYDAIADYNCNEDDDFGKIMDAEAPYQESLQ